MSQTFAVAKALVVNNNKILILRRSSSDVRRPLQWDIPGGAIEEGEDIKQACVREIAEESGIVLKATGCKTIYAATELVENEASATWIYLRITSRSTDVVLSNEHDQARWVTLDEALELFVYKRHLQLLNYVKNNSLLSAKTSD
jgi:8-oxo-dGTP diphosphatase